MEPETLALMLGKLEANIDNLAETTTRLSAAAAENIASNATTTELLKAGSKKFEEHKEILGDHEERVQAVEARKCPEVPKARTVIGTIVIGFAFVSIILVFFGYLVVNGKDQRASVNYSTVDE